MRRALSLPRLIAAGLCASLCATGCAGGGGAAAGQLAGQVLGSAIQAAASGSPRRRDTYEYRVEVARARAACARQRDAMQLLVLDAKAHLKTTDDVRVVRWEDCEVTWLDDCAVERSYGPARPREGDGARTLHVWDEVDLYELVPAWSPSWRHPIAEGRHLRVDAFVELVREAPAVRRADLPSTTACTGATHVVSSIELGALRVNVDPKDGLTERELDAQRELDLGGYTACRRGDGCFAVVAVGLTPLQ